MLITFIFTAAITAGIMYAIAVNTNWLKECPTKKEVEKKIAEAKEAQKKADEAAEAERRKKEEENRAKKNNNAGNNAGNTPNALGW